MINPHELRIGNYVNYPFGGMQKIRNGEDIDNIYESAGDPIPLTPELLEKCGFVKVGNLYSFYIKAKARTQLSDFEFIFAGNTCIVNNRLHIETGFLHQLQNLIFALTGEELEVKL